MRVLLVHTETRFCENNLRSSPAYSRYNRDINTVYIELADKCAFESHGLASLYPIYYYNEQCSFI